MPRGARTGPRSYLRKGVLMRVSVDNGICDARGQRTVVAPNARCCLSSRWSLLEACPAVRRWRTAGTELDAYGTRMRLGARAGSGAEVGQRQQATC